jgi:hypothetical protein
MLCLSSKRQRRIVYLSFLSLNCLIKNRWLSLIATISNKQYNLHITNSDLLQYFITVFNDRVTVHPSQIAVRLCLPGKDRGSQPLPDAHHSPCHRTGQSTIVLWTTKGQPDLHGNQGKSRKWYRKANLWNEIVRSKWIHHAPNVQTDTWKTNNWTRFMHRKKVIDENKSFWDQLALFWDFFLSSGASNNCWTRHIT